MNILDKIVAHKRTELGHLPDTPVTVDNLRAGVAQHGPRRDFIGSLLRPRKGNLGLIAEVKKASPSEGVIRDDFDPVAIAKTYETAGASCLSVLTDREFFQGSLDYLRAIREAVSLPLLRKDFMIDERQLPEAIEHGADAILLIVACLDDETLGHLHRLATGAGLAALVDGEGGEVSIVDADQAGVDGQGSFQLGLVVHLDQCRQPGPGGQAMQMGKLLVLEAGDDKQDGVRAVLDRLEQLPFVDHEILAQQRQ